MSTKFGELLKVWSSFSLLLLIFLTGCKPNLTGISTLISKPANDMQFFDHNFERVSYAGGLWTAVGGGILLSEDGKAWRWNSGGVPRDGFLSSIAYGNGRWVAVGWHGLIVLSTDGKSWCTVPNHFTTSGLNDIKFVNGVWVTVGYGGIFISPDGLNWQAVKGPMGSPSFQCLERGDGIWVALGSDTIATSKDGLNWKEAKVYPKRANLHCLRYGAGRWVAAGANGAIATSTDGQNWRTVAPQEEHKYFWHLEYGNGRWIIDGDRGLLTSVDALHWKLESTPVFGHPGMDLSYSNGLWVGVSGNGGVATSKDGVEWKQSEIDTGSTLHPDGSWTTSFQKESQGGWLHSPHYANGVWVAVGLGIVTSRDGVHWKQMIRKLRHKGKADPGYYDLNKYEFHEYEKAKFPNSFR